MTAFMFATGIENSAPIIAGPDGRAKRVDEMEKCGHYRRWREDLGLVRELGLRFLRYGVPYYRVHLGPGRYDWEFSDAAFGEIQRLKITPIADLCHFGLPDWLGDFQNRDFPRHFADYAEAFARRYPWIHQFTPVNEIFIAATFSGQYGWWNERRTDDGAFVRALANLCRANVEAMRRIVAAQPRAVFVQSESSEYYHPQHPSCEERADFLNRKRFLSLDLTYGHPIDALMYEYLLDHGVTRDEFHWFRDNQVKARCIMGNDYYVTNEHEVHHDGAIVAAGEIFGYYVITHQYYQRYRLPIMHTETNIAEPDAVAWLRKEWANLHRLKLDGVPVMGFTWYSLTDQVDWDTALREDAGRVNALGLYDLDRRLRPVGAAYRDLVEVWRGILPTETRDVRLQD